jgi:predicted nucleic acid-binding protein
VGVARAIALKWFLDTDEDELEPARELLRRHRDRQVLLHILDLTFYEVGNALLRGRAGASAEQTAAVIGALRDICRVTSPTADELAAACALAVEHQLTVSDAAYAAVGRSRGATLVTLDGAMLSAELGVTPSQLLQDIPAA